MSDTVKIREVDVEKKLGKRLKEMGVKYLKFVSPGETGVPDRLAVGHYGNVYFIELKRPQGSKTSAKQRYWNRIFNARWVKCFFVKNFNDIELAIKEIEEDEEYFQKHPREKRGGYRDGRKIEIA